MNRRTIGAVLVLLGLTLACFGRLVLHPTDLIVDADHPSLDHARPVDDPSSGNDLTRLFLPHHLGIARAIARLGHRPLWDDRGFGGRPLVGNPQAGLFYPPVWLTWWSEIPSSLGWITLAHLLFSGLGTYRLGRTLGLGEWGCLVAAGCVQASPYVLAQTFEGHYPHVWAACWYPWAFDAAIRVRRGENRSTLSLALTLAATFLAGHPQEGYYLLIALGSWAGFDGLKAIRARRWIDLGRLWGLWSLAVGLALGLVAVELIPDILAQPWSLKGAKYSLRLAGRYHLDPTNALQLLGPGALGGPSEYFGPENYWETVTSIGLIPLVLGLVAVAWSTDRKSVRGWLTLVVGSLVFASGRSLGLFAILYELVPGMERFRVPARSLFLASLGASMLAGLGVEALRGRSDDPKGWARLAGRFVLLASILASLVLLGGHLSGGAEGSRVLRSLARLAGDGVFFGSLGGAATLLVLGGRAGSNRKALAVGLGLLGLIELGVHGHDLIRTTPVAHFLDPDPISEALLKARTTGLEPPRIRTLDSLYDDLRAGASGFTKTNINDSFQIQHAADLYRQLYHLFDVGLEDRAVPQAILDRMGVSLLVSDHLDPDAPWPLVSSGTWRGSSYVVQANPSALPRAYVVPRSLFAPKDASLLEAFLKVDPHQAVLMASDPLGPESTPRQPFTPALWLSDDPDRVVLGVETQAPGLLVVAETWMPGWSSEVDGRPEPVLRGNHAQRVIPLRHPGRHMIALRYQTPGFTAGIAVSLLAALVWVALKIKTWIRPPLTIVIDRAVGSG